MLPCEGIKKKMRGEKKTPSQKNEQLTKGTWKYQIKDFKGRKGSQLFKTEDGHRKVIYALQFVFSMFDYEKIIPEVNENNLSF